MCICVCVTLICVYSFFCALCYSIITRSHWFTSFPPWSRRRFNWPSCCFPLWVIHTSAVGVDLQSGLQLAWSMRGEPACPHPVLIDCASVLLWGEFKALRNDLIFVTEWQSTCGRISPRLFHPYTDLHIQTYHTQVLSMVQQSCATWPISLPRFNSIIPSEFYLASPPVVNCISPSPCPLQLFALCFSP